MTDKQVMLVVFGSAAVVLVGAGLLLVPGSGDATAARPPATPAAVAAARPARAEARPPPPPGPALPGGATAASPASRPTPAPPPRAAQPARAAPPAPPLDGPARLEAALATLRARAPGTGASEAGLAAREAKLGRPIPAPVRRLLAAVPPSGWARFVVGIRLYWLPDCKFRLTAYGDDVAHTVPEAARDGPYFTFAVGDRGDEIVVDAAGRVIVADNADSPAVLGDSLAAWVERLVAYSGRDFAYVGGFDRLPPDRLRAFLTDHLRLNPGAEWAARHLATLAVPDGPPRGHLVWDKDAGRQVPAAEAPEASVRSLRLYYATPLDLQSVVGATGCVDLWITDADGRALDLRSLARMAALAELLVQDVYGVDASQLAGHPSLAEAYFRRCTIANIDALVAVKTLKVLVLIGCQVDAAELARFRSRRPEVAVELE